MLHLGWYAFTPTPAKPVPMFVMAGEELVRLPIKNRQTVKSMCNKDVPACEITTDVKACECPACRRIHARDLSR